MIAWHDLWHDLSQLYYLGDDDAYEIVKTFNYKPEQFDYNVLLTRLDALVSDRKFPHFSVWLSMFQYHHVWSGQVKLGTRMFVECAIDHSRTNTIGLAAIT